MTQMPAATRPNETLRQRLRRLYLGYPTPISRGARRIGKYLKYLKAPLIIGTGGLAGLGMARLLARPVARAALLDALRAQYPYNKYPDLVAKAVRDAKRFHEGSYIMPYNDPGTYEYARIRERLASLGAAGSVTGRRARRRGRAGALALRRRTRRYRRRGRRAVLAGLLALRRRALSLRRGTREAMRRGRLGVAHRLWRSRALRRMGRARGARRLARPVIRRAIRALVSGGRHFEDN